MYCTYIVIFNSIDDKQQFCLIANNESYNNEKIRNRDPNFKTFPEIVCCKEFNKSFHAEGLLRNFVPICNMPHSWVHSNLMTEQS